MRQKKPKPPGRPRRHGIVWPVFDGMESTAEHIGAPLSLLKHAKRSGCDGFRSGRVYVEDLLPFLFAHLLGDRKVPEGFSSIKEWADYNVAAREAIKLKREQSLVVDLAEVKQLAGEAEGYYFAELERAERELPAQLAGLSAMEIFAILKKWFKELRESSRKHFKKVSQP